MRDTCIYCNAPLGERDPGINENGHGLCSDCLSVFASGKGEPVQEFLDSLPESVFLVNKDAVIIGANQRAQELASWNPEADAPALAGEIFECAHASSPGGCGRTIHCRACTIRQCITRTGATGESMNSVPAYMDLGDVTLSTTVRFLISTEKIGRHVLLLIEEISPVENVPSALGTSLTTLPQD